MKVKFGFSLVLILVILFCMSMAGASENITQDTDNPTMSEDLLLSENVGEIKESVDENPILSENNDDLINSSTVELEVDIEPDVNKVKKGDIVTWTVTVKSVGGVSYNAYVVIDFSEGLDYVESQCDVGSFDFNTGVWDIGDLEQSDIKYLTIKTKVIERGTERAYASAFADSETGMINSFAGSQIIVEPSDPYVISDPDKRKNDKHQPHYLSYHQSGYRSLTKSAGNNFAEAKIEMKPTGNPILIFLFSLMSLIGVSFKRY